MKSLTIIAVILLLSLTANAASLDSSGASPQKIFKCQSSTITGNFTGAVGAVTLFVNVSGIMVNGSVFSENNMYVMNNMGGGMWGYVYGNDPTMLRGNKTIWFKTDTNTGYNSTGGYIFVYSDPCTGSNIQGYRNTTYRTAGFGNYTRALFTGQQNLLEFAVQPSLNTFGSLIYILMMFLICVVIYMKNQSVIQPIIIAFIVSASLIASNLMPQEYRIYALFLTGIAVAAIFWRLGKSV